LMPLGRDIRSMYMYLFNKLPSSYAWAIHGSIANAPPFGGAVSSMVWSVDNDFSGNRLRLTGRDGGTHWQAPMQRGQWYDWTFHVKFSENPGVGYLELWRDGNRVTFSKGSTRRYFSTLSPNRQPGSCGNLQVTNYRRHRDFSVVTMYHDEVKVGTSYAAVQPGR
jgi:hypothetical protein